MKFNELKLDTAYRVVGSNDQFNDGDVIWVDSASKLLNNATAKEFLLSDELTANMFDGICFEQDPRYEVHTSRYSSTLTPKKGN